MTTVVLIGKTQYFGKQRNRKVGCALYGDVYLHCKNMIIREAAKS